MRNIPKICFFFVALLLISLGIGTLGKENDMKITISEALTRANLKAKNLGYNISQMEVFAEEDNATWKSYFEIAKTNAPSVWSHLAGKNYYAIYYRPKKNDTIFLGGDLWIFIDCDTGEVITFFKGK